MSRAAVRPALVAVALAWPVVGGAQTADAPYVDVPRADSSAPEVAGTDAFRPSAPREVRLPQLEVPDDRAKIKGTQVGSGPGTGTGIHPRSDRSALLNQSIELSDERDRRTLAREQDAWGRLSGSLCTGCGAEPRRSRRVALVDPIAVLNAKPSPARIPAARPADVLAAAQAAAARVVAPAQPRIVAARPVAAPTTATPPALVATAAPPAASSPAGASARPVAGRTAILVRRKVRPAHNQRVQLAHRRGSRTKFGSYLGRVRYAFLRWRHHRQPVHHHRRMHR